MEHSGDYLERRQYSLEDALQALQQFTGRSVPSAIVYGLSGITRDEATTFLRVWGQIEPAHRRHIMRVLADTAEADFELDYTSVAQMALRDEDATVREAAIDALFASEDTETMDLLIACALHDPSIDVRAAAFSALGSFILAGEFEDIAAQDAARAQDAALQCWQNEQEDIDVRRRALEALAHSSREEVYPAIMAAFQHEDRRMRISAVFAMGKSCDERWTDVVLAELDNADPEMRYEAARAAGELEIQDAVPSLKALAFSDDVEIRDVAVWSLGEIGGREAKRALELLAQDAKARNDEDLLEAVDDALANAEIGSNDLYLFDIDPDRS